MEILRRKSKKFGVAFLLLALVILITNTAFAVVPEEVSLKSVIVEGSTYPLSDTTEITLAGEFNINSTPEFELRFSHRVTNDDFLQDNQDKIYIANAETGGTLLCRYGEVGQTSLTVRPSAGLERGSYQIVVEPGIEANAGVTTEEYIINFHAGAIPDDEGDPEPGTYTITFNVSNVKGTPYFVQVKDVGNRTVQPREDGAFQLGNGNYTYFVSASGYVTAQGSFSVNDANKAIDVSMTDSAIVTFSTTPGSATVRVKSGQDDFIEPISAKVFDLRPGFEYTYVVEGPGYTAQSKRFTPIDDMNIVIILETSEHTGDGYYEQGNGGNTLTMLVPGADDIEVIEETDRYYYNKITKAFSAGEAIEFGFTMSAGINSFGDGSNFRQNNMPLIGIYAKYNNGPVGSPLAKYDSGSGKLKYIGYDANAAAGRVITISVDAGVLAAGDYVLVFGHNVCGNNTNKTIGKDIVFAFTVGGGGDGGSPGGTPGSTPPGTPGTATPLETPGTTPPETPTLPTENDRVKSLEDFTDVDPDAWYAGAISFVANKGLFLGTSDTEFSPNRMMNRGMFVTVLGKLAGIDSSGITSDTVFSDVSPNAYYASYVSWAVNNKVIQGYDDNSFRADNSITRQETVVILYNFAKTKDYDLGKLDESRLNGFSDAALTAPWAREAMSWAINSGIVIGKENNNIDPLGTATRAEVAQLIKIFAEMFVK